VTTLALVRHGRAEAGWDTSLDPGLDATGRAQAEAVADVLVADMPVRPIVSSPLLRCRQTAAPLAARWGVDTVVAPAVRELPSPAGYEMHERVDWLRAVMGGTWADLGPDYVTFRDECLAFLLGLPDDAVVFSHFIAINAVIGASTGDDRLVIRSLDNCSVTTIEVADGRFTLVEGGAEADTLIR
jgi:broad specificity phosphatase PhoE